MNEATVDIGTEREQPQCETVELKLLPEQEVIDYQPAKKWPQVFAAFAAAMGIFILGSTFGWSSSVQSQLLRRHNGTEEEDFFQENSTSFDVHLNSDEMSWAGSLVMVGCLMGSLMGGFLMDKFGRRKTLLSMSFPYIIGWLLITFAVNPGMIYGGRVICGLAAGICSAVVPCYVGEIATLDMRGTLGMFFSVGLSAGFLFTSLLVWLPWRWISGVLAIPSIVLFIAMYFAPESPYFLIKRGRLALAERALLWLRGPRFKIAIELGQIQNRVRLDSTRTSRITDIFHPWAYKPVMIGAVMMIFLQFSGLNAAMFNAVAIFQLAGSTIDPAFCAVIIAAVQLVMSFASSMFLVRRFGRTTLHAATELFASFCMFVLGGYFYILENDPPAAAPLGWLPLTCLVGFIAAAAAGIAPLSWVVSSEVLPARFRGPGSSIVSFTSWLCAFIVTKTYLDIQRSLSTAGVFWIFGSFCLIGVFFSSFLLPETKGKTTEEIQSIFETPKGNQSIAK